MIEPQYDNGDIPDERSDLDVATAIVNQWEKHDKFRVVAGEPNGEPDDVRVSKALINIKETVKSMAKTIEWQDEEIKSLRELLSCIW